MTFPNISSTRTLWRLGPRQEAMISQQPHVQSIKEPSLYVPKNSIVHGPQNLQGNRQVPSDRVAKVTLTQYGAGLLSEIIRDTTLPGIPVRTGPTDFTPPALRSTHFYSALMR